jgi:hypothetical protein
MKTGTVRVDLRGIDDTVALVRASSDVLASLIRHGVGSDLTGDEATPQWMDDCAGILREALQPFMPEGGP